MSDDTLVINPHAQLIPLRDRNSDDRCDPAIADRFVITAPRRGRPWKQYEVVKRESPELFRALREIYESNDDVEIESEELQEYLIETGFFTTEDEISEAVNYACYFDDERLRSEARMPEPGDFIVNPDLLVQHSAAQPAEVVACASGFDRFLPDYPVLWIRDDLTGLRAPYWAKNRGRGILAALERGAPAPRIDDKELLARLVAAKILVPRDREVRGRERERRIAEARSSHDARGFASLGGILPPLHVSALDRYFGRLIEEGMMPFGDEQVKRRWHLHNEALAIFWHQQLADFFSAIVGRSVKATYCYFARYEEGAVLAPHTDRKAAEFTASVQIGFEPEPEGKAPWKLYVDLVRPKEETLAVELGIGESLFYRGYELRHYRRALPKGRKSSSLFFHFVDQSVHTL